MEKVSLQVPNRDEARLCFAGYREEAPRLVVRISYQELTIPQLAATVGYLSIAQVTPSRLRLPHALRLEHQSRINILPGSTIEHSNVRYLHLASRK